MRDSSFITSIKFEENKKVKNQAAVIISPCYPGYGITLGNALRRVAISSLSGAAVIAVKIKGARHEFSTLSGIKEDVLEIILNLKQLHLSLYSDQPVVLNLKANGEKIVTAKDIISNAQVTIANPELVIATMTDKKASLDMKIWVDNGRGYQPSEEKGSKDLEVNTILVDSIFNPVLAVNFKRENIRVGKKTNYDQVVLTIKTDGTITPQQAFIETTKILSEQFSSLLLVAQSIYQPKKKIVEKSKTKKIVSRNKKVITKKKVKSISTSKPSKKKIKKVKKVKKIKKIKKGKK
ncbi:MAG: DNA-directed RNA polymerase subunit alpha [Candidatus Aenigmarchaeota archaeon]|nr:DNA-directed RNA polymerase subunit alpha [Candidatus Aenigmarchaeota archaeon]